jgi:hypothetical protein
MVCIFPKQNHVNQHERAAHMVKGHFRNAIWIAAHMRSSSTVHEYCKS